MEVAYKNPDRLSPRDLEDYVRQLGGELDTWRAQIKEVEHVERLHNDLELAQKLGVQGTPTFFLNGVRILGIQDQNVFEAMIENQIARADLLLEAGVPANELYWRAVANQFEFLPDEYAAMDETDEAVDELMTFVPVGNSPTIGADSDDALVTIVEFVDFQCAFCARSNTVMSQIIELYGDRVRRVFKHYPLPFHDRAGHAAALSVLAHHQGQFWNAHEVLFKN